MSITPAPMILLRFAQGFLFLLPFQVAVPLFPGVDLAFVRPFSLALFSLWLVEGFIRKKILIPFSLSGGILLSFVFLSSISFLWADQAGWALRRATFFLSFTPLFFVFSSLVMSNGRKGVFSLLQPFALGAGAAALIGVIQFSSQFFFGVSRTFHFWIESVLPVFLGPSFAGAVAQYPSLLANIGGVTMLRATAFFPDPHMFAFYMGMAAPLALGLFFEASDRSKKILFMGVFVLILVADLLSFSRGGYLGLVFGMIFFFVVSLVRGKRGRGLLALGAGLLILFPILFFDNPVKNRVMSSFSLEDGSNQGRLDLWRQGSGDIARQPWLGYGAGNYPVIAKPTASYREPIYMHNMFLDIASETGVIGSALFFLALLLVIRGFLMERTILGLSGAVALVVFFGHSLVELPLYSVHIFPLILLLFAIPEALLASRKSV